MHLKKLMIKPIAFKNISLYGYSDYGLPFKSRIAIYKTYIRPLLEYGLQLCYLKDTHIQKINSIQHYFLCKLLSISIYSSKNMINAFLKIPTFETRWNIFRIKYHSRLTKFTNNYSTYYNFASILTKSILQNDRAINRNLIVIKRVLLDKPNLLKINNTNTTNKLCSNIARNSIKLSCDSIKQINIPNPKHFYFLYPDKYLPIFEYNQSDRCLRLYALNKFPGVKVTCSLCNYLTTSFIKHIISCRGFQMSDYDKFNKLDEITRTEWSQIISRNELVPLMKEVKDLIEHER